MAYNFRKGNSECKTHAIYCNYPETKTSDYKMTTSVINFIKNHNYTHKPFYISAGFLRPHINLAIPYNYVNNINLPPLPNITRITPTKNLNYYNCNMYRRRMKFGNKLSKFLDNKSRSNSWDVAEKYPRDTRKFIQWYLASISFVDAQIGRIIKSLNEIGQYDNTIIAFHSDHGWNSGHHGQWCKNSLFKKITRTPLIIKSVNSNSKIIEERPVEVIDIFPTFINEVGLINKKPDKLDGKIITNLNNDIQNYYAFSQYPRCNKLGKIQGSACMLSEKILAKICQVLNTWDIQ